MASTLLTIVAGSVPNADTSCPPVSPLNRMTPKRVPSVVRTRLLTAALATWIRVTAGISARCVSVAWKYTQLR